jgi:hypothetical protein
MQHSSADISRRKRERLPLISLAILTAGFALFVSLTFLMWWSFMPERDNRYSDPDLSPSQAELANRLESDVRHLAETIGERNMHRRGTMDTTTAWIETRFREMGYEPVRHTYELQRSMYAGRTADNIIAELPGNRDPETVIIVGAHYDTVPGSPGANDNGSAVAALLALADYFSNRAGDFTIRFLAFANEEPPFFKTRDMGSYAYARTLKERNEQVKAMFSMDGLGSFSTEPGSQHYPLPGIGLFYPDRADFIGFVTRFRDMKLMKKALKTFRGEAEIAAEGVALPGLVPGVDWSDHWSFWQHDFPAFLVTDTLPFRDRYYHTPMDTPDKIDFERMALVVEGLKRVVADLAAD